MRLARTLFVFLRVSDLRIKLVITNIPTWYTLKEETPTVSCVHGGWKVMHLQLGDWLLVWGRDNVSDTFKNCEVEQVEIEPMDFFL